VAGRIFISYSQKQPQPTRDIAAFLRAEGYSVWTDADLIPGDRREVIDRELNAADAVIVILAGDSVASDWVISEAEHGRSHGKLIPLKTRDLTAPIPKPFDAFHTSFVDDGPAILAAVRRAAGERPPGAASPVAIKRWSSLSWAYVVSACVAASLAGVTIALHPSIIDVGARLSNTASTTPTSAGPAKGEVLSSAAT
jgi:hypothetical protein